MTIIRIHVKKILTGNFVFMSLVAIIFGILTLFSKGQEKIIGSYTYIDMLWKGYIFLYFIFAVFYGFILSHLTFLNKQIQLKLFLNLRKIKNAAGRLLTRQLR